MRGVRKHRGHHRKLLRYVVSLASVTAIVGLSLVGANIAQADAPDPILATTAGSVSLPSGPTGPVRLTLSGSWQWTTHSSDCNTNRAGVGFAVDWNDSTEPGFFVANDPNTGQPVDVGVATVAGDRNAVDNVVHPTPNPVFGFFNDVSSPSLYKSWRSGCGTFSTTTHFNSGTWGPISHDYAPGTTSFRVCALMYDVHGSNTNNSPPRSASEITAGGTGHNSDNSLQKNAGTPLGNGCFAFTGQPHLTFSKSGPASVALGGTVTYHVLVTNDGSAPTAAGVTVTDTLASSLSGISASFSKNSGSSTSCGSPSGQTVTCALGVLAAGDHVDITITATAPSSSCPTISDTASVQVGTQAADHTNTVTTNVTGCAPGLTISKTGPANVALGGTVTYHVLVSNTGTADTASGVTVTDTLASSLSGISASFSKNSSSSTSCGSPSGQTVTCALGVLAAGDHVDITITATAPSSGCPTITDTASVRVGEGASADTNTVTTQVTGCAPNVTITKSGPASVGQGGSITYTVTVHNSGNTDASDVRVTDNLDDSLRNVSAHFGTEGSCAVGTGNVVTCSLGTVGAGSTVTVTITANAPTGTCPTIANQASFTTSGGEGPGGTSNTVTTTVTGCAPPPPPPPPGLGIKLVKGGPALAHVGETVTYTFAASLATSTPLGNITLTDPICSAAPALVSKTGGNQDTTLEAGETWNYSCTHVVTATDPDPLANTATVTGTASSGQQTSAQATHTVDIIHPAIRIVKTAKPTSVAPGDQITYTYKVTNTGDVTLFDVKVTDNKLGTICTIAQLDVGRSQTCTDTFKAPSASGPLDNVGTAAGHDETGLSVKDTDRASVAVVLGTTVTPPPTLAFTGATGSVPLAGLALVLLLLGSGILFFTRRREDGSATWLK